jgi:hypothetical protein
MTEKPIEEKESFNIRKWIGGNSQKEFLENISYLVIFISAVMVSIGVGLGSFIGGTILIAILGALFVLIGVVFYVASQFIGE